MKKLFENKALLTKILFSTSLIFVLSFSVALAQFARNTGDTGWNYGYGYGYSYGYGFDGGTLYGYLIDSRGDYNENTHYGYGYGYGYISAGASYDEEEGAYVFSPEDLSNLVTAGIAVPEGDDNEHVISLTMNDNLLIQEDEISVLIPDGTVITDSEGETFDGTMIITADVTETVDEDTIDSNADVAGSVEFGISGTTLYFSQPVTVIIPVDSSLNGETLNISRSPDNGETWESTGLTAESTDTCTDGEGSDPITTAVVADGTITIYTCRASYFATYSVSTPTGGSGGLILQQKEEEEVVPPAEPSPKPETNTIEKDFTLDKPAQPATKNTTLETQATTLYKKLFGSSPATGDMKIVYFIAYGTTNTASIGAGERAGVVGSYFAAYGKKPTTDANWSDVAKIANGRWPSETSQKAIDRAKVQFKKIYLRDAVMTNKYDNAAVTIMAYGLRPAARNLNSEKAAIKSFRAIYKKYSITLSTDWDIVRAIAYSGAKR